MLSVGSSLLMNVFVSIYSDVVSSFASASTYSLSLPMATSSSFLSRTSSSVDVSSSIFPSSTLVSSSNLSLSSSALSSSASVSSSISINAEEKSECVLVLSLATDT